MTHEHRGDLDESGVLALGHRLGLALAPGDVLALVGPLGAGKSALARAVLYGAGLDPRARVASPTFTLVQEHPARFPVHHADVYRLTHPRDLDEVGLLERDDVATIIEWADRFPEVIPGDALWVELTVTDEFTRAVRLWGEGPRAARLIDAASR
jgi:tRNA threonylcarbamoyl adenosine modification protein YjeE